jgi:hypothetical protein
MKQIQDILLAQLEKYSYEKAEKSYEFQTIQLWNPGILFGKLPKHILETIKIHCVDSDLSEYELVTSELAGYIRKEYKYPLEINPYFERYLKLMAEQWSSTFKYNFMEDFGNFNFGIPNYKVDSVWFNVQEQNEFNPNHIHSGNLSFISWIQFPDLKKDQSSKDDWWQSKNSRNPESCLEFTYSTFCNGLHQHRVYFDESYIGSIMMFPAKLQHCVYPFFNSNTSRISIAGNLSVYCKKF